MMNQTGCDGVVVGRGCLGRPWLFAQLAAQLRGEPVPEEPTLGEVARIVMRHAELLAAHEGEQRGCRDIRKHIGWYFHGFPVGGQFRSELSRVSTLDELRDKLSTIADNPARANAAEEALTAADSLKEIRERCEHRSMQLLVRENPVATELRQVFTSIYIVEDFSRMGALAKHVANTARLRYPEEVVDKQLQSTVRELAKMVDTMGELIHDQLISPDADLALEINEIDDHVDELHRYLLTTVTGKDWEGSSRAAVDAALIGRFYERYADHCVNVGARIVYLVTGLTSEVYAQSRDETPTSEMEERLRNLEQYWRK